MPERPTYEELEQRVRELLRSESNRKLAVEALLESEKRYRAVAEDTPMLICRFLPGGEITYVNQAYCNYFEKTPEELVGSSFLSLIPEAGREPVMANISALTVESPTQSHEHRVIAANGKIRWQRWTHRGLFGATGEPLAYQSIGDDITERKRTEGALRESEERYRTLVEENPHGVQEIDSDGIIVFANAAHCEMLGYEEAELIGRSAADFLVPGPQRDELPRYLRTLVQDQPAPSLYFQKNLKKDGEVRDVEVSWNYLRDQEGH